MVKLLTKIVGGLAGVGLLAHLVASEILPWLEPRDKYDVVQVGRVIGKDKVGGASGAITFGDLVIVEGVPVHYCSNSDIVAFGVGENYKLDTLAWLNRYRTIGPEEKPKKGEKIIRTHRVDGKVASRTVQKDINLGDHVRVEGEKEYLRRNGRMSNVACNWANEGNLPFKVNENYNPWELGMDLGNFMAIQITNAEKYYPFIEADKNAINKIRGVLERAKQGKAPCYLSKELTGR